MRLTARTTMSVLVLAACGVAALYLFPTILPTLWPAPRPASAPALATPAPAVADMEVVEIGAARVRALPARAKARLKLPAAAQAAPTVQALAASTVAADDRPHTLITTLDTETGAVTTYDRREPLPWFARAHHGGIGLGTGFVNGMRRVNWIEAHQDLLQSKAVFLSATGYLDDRHERRAGLYLEYRW